MSRCLLLYILSSAQVASLLAVSRANGIDAHMTRAELGEAGRV